MPTATSRLWCLVSLVSGLGYLSGCGGVSDVGILVNLGNVPAAAQTIAAKGTLDGLPTATVSEQELPAAGLSRFGLLVPSNLTGGLNIELTALDADRCVQGTAQTSLSLPTERGKEIVADFMTLTPRKCTSPPPPPTCAKNTLCTYAFSPTNKTLYSVFAITPNDIWAVGSVGTVVHWDGQAWRGVSVPAAGTRDLFDVWASGPKDVWVVGADTPSSGGITLHYDGAAWTAVPNGSSYDLNGIHGLSANEVYAVGDNDPALSGPGEFWKWNGSQWSKMANAVNGQLWRVFAVSSTEIWAAGFNSTFIKHNGTSATFVSLSGIGLSASGELRGIWGTGSSNLFLVGSNGFAAHYNGSAWARMTQTATTTTLYAVQGTTATGTIYALGNNGWLFTSDPPYAAFTPLANPPANSTSLRELAIASDGSAWVVGVNGFIGQLGMQ